MASRTVLVKECDAQVTYQNVCAKKVVNHISKLIKSVLDRYSLKEKVADENYCTNVIVSIVFLQTEED